MFSAADHVLPPLGDKMPRAPSSARAAPYGHDVAEIPVNDWFFKGYEAANGIYPVQTAYRMTQAITPD